MSAPTPGPPGTTSTSSCGQSASAVSATNAMPVSAVTGPVAFQSSRTFASGTRASTSNGPVMSSWVRRGNSRKPISMAMRDAPGCGSQHGTARDQP